MQVRLNSIDGIDMAIKALFISKRNLTPEKESHIEYICDKVLTRQGVLNYSADESDIDEFKDYLNRTFKYGKIHEVLLSFIDLSYTVRGLHRAGQDDWDAHAKRYDNRIVRESTRLADFNGTEKSTYYEGKILTIDDVLNMIDISLPNTIEHNGSTFIKATNGYIREDLKNINDVKRGLYMESIPSSFVFKCNLSQFAHVYKMRNEHGTSHPEVKECCEACVDEVSRFNLETWINRELLNTIKN